MNSRDGLELRVKQEGEAKKIPTTRSQWTSHKNPRIVRVSRTFGGKDRHSKVCTVRGLRDRRIRLSVPTAIQLYDLQERLGLSQPSKVVDWLLDATKDDIDTLPPLPPIIPGHMYQSLPQSSLKNNDAVEKDHHQSKWIDQENHEGFGGFVAQLSAQNLFPLNNVQSSFQNNYNLPYFHWDHPNLSYPLPNQAADDHQSLFFCPTATTIPSFPSYIAPPMENNPLFSTALHLSSPMKAFALNLNSKSAHPQHNDHGKEE